MISVNLRPYSVYDCHKMINWCFANFGSIKKNGPWGLDGLRKLTFSDNHYLMFQLAWGHILRDQESNKTV